MSRSLFTLLGLLTGPILVLTLTCNSDYEARSSTLCLTDSPLFTSGGVSDADKLTIINLHNSFRAGVSPTSSSMVKAIWDDNLAAMAQKWAQQCQDKHDTSSARYIIEYSESPGQNAAFQHSDWTAVVTDWHSEVSDFTYGTGGGGKVVGHYTQVVQGGVARIGCGLANCNTADARYYFCNYIVANENEVSPYKQGASCADCNAKCSGEKLCDCAGKHCFNGGTLDLNTCTCTCAGSIFSGDQCLTKLCPPDEPSTCDPNADCEYYYQLKETCPFSCKICKLSEATPCSEHPKCHQSTYGCKYMGDQHTTAQCATYGVSGEDSQFCKSTGGTWAGCEECEMYNNIPTQYCPKMCAICPE